MVTIKDVVAKADMNPSTVSRVLKDNRSISRKTKDKVRKAMVELGYVPNIAAQVLASGSTYSVGLIFPPLMTPDHLDEPFFMQVLSIVTSEAKLNGFAVSIATGMTVDELEEQVKLMYRQKRVDSFIILYSDPDGPVRKYLMDDDMPFAIVGTPESFENDITYVDNDDQLMEKEAVEYLYQKGHREILFVTDDLKSEVSSKRYFDYLRGMEKLELDSNPALLFDRRDPMVLEELIQRTEESKATALVVIIDTISARITQFLSHYQLSVPDDIPIITFDSSAYSTLVHPYLATFDISVSNLGRTSFRRSVELIKSPRTAIVEKVIVPFTLREHESVHQLHVND